MLNSTFTGIVHMLSVDFGDGAEEKSPTLCYALDFRRPVRT
jgi:hypothetical protein